MMYGVSKLKHETAALVDAPTTRESTLLIEIAKFEFSANSLVGTLERVEFPCISSACFTPVKIHLSISRGSDDTASARVHMRNRV